MVTKDSLDGLHLQIRRQRYPRTWRRWDRRSDSCSCVVPTSRCCRQNWTASTPPSWSPWVRGWATPPSGSSRSVKTPSYSSRPTGSLRQAARSRWYRRGLSRDWCPTCLLRKFGWSGCIVSCLNSFLSITMITMKCCICVICVTFVLQNSIKFWVYPPVLLWFPVLCASSVSLGFPHCQICCCCQVKITNKLKNSLHCVSDDSFHNADSWRLTMTWC